MSDTLTTELTIHPARNLLGSVRLPGDKSISHRYALLGGFAYGKSRFHNFSTGADCASSLACMQQMGAKVTRTGDTVEVEGCGGVLTPPRAVLDCGNSGSTAASSFVSASRLSGEGMVTTFSDTGGAAGLSSCGSAAGVFYEASLVVCRCVRAGDGGT